MGAWGTGLTENDDAADFLAGLAVVSGYRDALTS